MNATSFPRVSVVSPPPGSLVSPPRASSCRSHSGFVPFSRPSSTSAALLLSTNRRTFRRPPIVARAVAVHISREARGREPAPRDHTPVQVAVMVLVPPPLVPWQNLLVRHRLLLVLRSRRG